MNWNSNTLSKLTELCEELKSHNPIQETMKNAILKLNNEVEDYFRNVLNKNGITESEWLENGNCEIQGILKKYFYKGKNIFTVSFPRLDLQPESTEGKYSVYFWEPEEIVSEILEILQEEIIPISMSLDYGVMSIFCHRCKDGVAASKTDRIVIEKDSQAYVYFWNSNLRNPVRIYYNEKGNVYKAEEV